jgi:hypothetical protein
MIALVLKKKILYYYPTLQGSTVLSNELVKLMEENEVLHEKRTSLLFGLRYNKGEVACKIFDEFGLTPSGEYLRFKSYYFLSPHPKRT